MDSLWATFPSPFLLSHFSPFPSFSNRLYRLFLLSSPQTLISNNSNVLEKPRRFLMTLKFIIVVKWKSLSVLMLFISPFPPYSKFWISSSTTWRLLGKTWTRRPSRRCGSSRWSNTTAPSSSQTKCGSEWAHSSQYRLAALLVLCKHVSLPLSVLPHQATMPMSPLIMKIAPQHLPLVSTFLSH